MTTRRTCKRRCGGDGNDWPQTGQVSGAVIDMSARACRNVIVGLGSCQLGVDGVKRKKHFQCLESSSARARTTKGSSAGVSLM
jgi:hypothetical protein